MLFRSGNAIFSGDVVIGQGELQITAAKVEVFYLTGNDSGPGDISKMVATGGVTLKTGTENVESEMAEYLVETGMLSLTGNVTLTQGNSILSSNKMTINLNSGTASLDGRVRTVLQTGDSK